MLSADYKLNNYIHYIEIDYISGIFEPDGRIKEMWGGFAHIVLLNEPTKKPLKI